MDNEQIAHAEHAEHIVPVSVYMKTYLVLLIGLVVTVLAAKVHIGPEGTSFFNNAVALTIAVAKGAIVVLIFMGVRYSTRLVWLWAGVGFVWLFIMFGLMADYFTRIYVRGW
jgi:cytochrome c oxidase subunit 4